MVNEKGKIEEIEEIIESDKEPEIQIKNQRQMRKQVKLKRNIKQIKVK